MCSPSCFFYLKCFLCPLPAPNMVSFSNSQLDFSSPLGCYFTANLLEKAFPDYPRQPHIGLHVFHFHRTLFIYYSTYIFLILCNVYYIFLIYCLSLPFDCKLRENGDCDQMSDFHTTPPVPRFSINIC